MADAVIIPFPKQRARVTSSSPEDERLQVALAGLQAALADQAQAVAEWRFAMAELGVGVAALGHSVGEYEGAISTLDIKLAELHQTATGLESIVSHP